MPTELIRTTLLALALLALKNTAAPAQCTAKMCSMDRGPGASHR